jgi:predicted DNA-binding transcriptional regulator AlpA
MNEQTNLEQQLGQQIALLQEINANLAAASSTPWSQVLWSMEEVAQYMGLRPRTVRENIACRPDFPKPTRLSNSLRWYAAEVAEWVVDQRAH